MCWPRVPSTPRPVVAGFGGENRQQDAENFRSRPLILEFVNAVFAPLLREEIGGHIEGDSLLGEMLQRQAMGAIYDDSIKPKIQAFLMHLGAGAYEIFDVKPK